jgi:hypothetical protein
LSLSSNRSSVCSATFCPFVLNYITSCFYLFVYDPNPDMSFDTLLPARCLVRSLPKPNFALSRRAAMETSPMGSQTPLFHSSILSKRLGCNVYLKLEVYCQDRTLPSTHSHLTTISLRICSEDSHSSIEGYHTLFSEESRNWDLPTLVSLSLLVGTQVSHLRKWRGILT